MLYSIETGAATTYGTFILQKGCTLTAAQCVLNRVHWSGAQRSLEDRNVILI